jgi:hypothetical protein
MRTLFSQDVLIVVNRDQNRQFIGTDIKLASGVGCFDSEPNKSELL